MYGGAISNVFGGLTGGIIGGFRANKLGLDFWNGKSLNTRTLNMISESFTLGSSVESTDENLMKATKAWYPDAPLNKVKVYSVENLSGHAKSQFSANPSIGGLTVPTAKGSVLSGNSKVFFNASVAFSSPEELYKVIGHELLHVSQISLLAGEKVSLFSGSFIDLMEYHAYSFRSTPGLSAWNANDVRLLMTNYPKWFTKLSKLNFQWTYKARPYINIFEN